MKKIHWGIIGCGDVTEFKSGPAFNKVANSSLVAVMRRDPTKAEDYARRHNVPKWYTEAGQLIKDPDVNAIYVATPPSTHEEFTLAAIDAGKPVYVEKPMALNYAAALTMAKAAAEKKVKLVVAHYRRQWPLFKKIKQLLDDKAIGDTRFARLDLYKQALTKEELLVPKTAWRVNPAIAGGGLFHDLAPHQLDLMYHFFGDVQKAGGIALNQSGKYAADDLVAGNILFRSGVVFNGLWCFSVSPGEERDHCEIIGSAGKISFSVFGDPTFNLTTQNGTETFSFEPLQHVQQPMIEKTVEFLLDESPNPCSGEQGTEVMRLIGIFTGK